MTKPALLFLIANIGVFACANADAQSDSLMTLKFKSPVLSVAYAKGTIAVSSGNEIHILNNELEGQASIKTEMDFVNDIGIHKNLLIAAGGNPAEHGMVETYSWPTRKLLRRRIVHDDVILQISTVNGVLVSASTDSTVKSIALPSLTTSKTYSNHSKRVTSAVTLSGEKDASPTVVVSGGLDDTLRVWELKTGKTLRTLTHHQDDVLGIDSKKTDDDSLPMIVSVSRDKTIRFWQPTIGRMVRFKKLDDVPTVAKWIPNTNKVLVGTDRGRLLLLDSVSLESMSLADVEQRIYSMVILDENRVLIGSSRGLHRINY